MRDLTTGRCVAYVIKALRADPHKPEVSVDHEDDREVVIGVHVKGLKRKPIGRYALDFNVVILRSATDMTRGGPVAKP